MTSVTKVAGYVFAGAAVSLAMVSLTQAATVAVNDEAPLTIQSPGFSYVASQNGQTSELSVSTQGYLFCANVILEDQDPSVITLAPRHPRWTLPNAFITGVSYSDGELSVNRSNAGQSVSSTLACHARGAQGEVFNPFSRFGADIFRNGYEGKEPTQYGSMVNWQPVDGFDWSAPDWAQVPTDSCQFAMTPEDSPAVEEATLCGAATGVVQGGEFGTRSPTMWTASSGTSFVYLARIDVRLGAQGLNVANEGFQAIESAGIEGVPDSVDFEVRDGYDSQYLSDSYTYCLLASLPASLSATTCNGNNPTSASGVVARALTMDFLTVTSLSRYLVVIRTKTTDLPSIQTPVAAVAVMSDPVVTRSEQGDSFVGDNVIFGFPGTGAFPWMTQ